MRGDRSVGKFLLNVIDSETGSRTGDELTAIGAFTARLESAGQLIMAEGLVSP